MPEPASVERRERARVGAGRLGDERAQAGVGGVGAVEGSEVKPGGRKEGDEATHKGARGEGEGGALLRRVLVAGVVEATESGLGYRAPRSVSGITVDE